MLHADNRLADTGLFERSALASLLDAYPPLDLRINSLGEDAQDASTWGYCDPGNLDGEAILSAVDRGRIWLNILDVGRHDQAHAALLADIQADLNEAFPEAQITRVKANVLVSSPTAVVFYHSDPEPNMLFQVQGTKRVWVYPVTDELAPPLLLEQIYAGDEEELPFDPAFDAQATVIDLTPGAGVTWPQNCPHRVTNLDSVNISLSLSYYTAAAERRALQWAANHYFRSTFRVPGSMKDRGLVTTAKITTFRGLRKLKIGKGSRVASHPMIYRYGLDPEAPLGRQVLSSPRPARA